MVTPKRRATYLGSSSVSATAGTRHGRASKRLAELTSRAKAKNVFDSLGNVLKEVTSVASSIEEAVENPFKPLRKAEEKVLPGPKVRPRTGKPVVDGLVGVEANPGPRNRRVKSRNHGQVQRPPNKGVNMNGRVGFDGKLGVSQMPVTSGYSGANMQDYSFATRRVMGIPALVMRGTCMIQAVTTSATGAAQFQDGGGNLSSVLYLNPGICCQNVLYHAPQGFCPIGVLAQAFRKFCFLQARLVYVPASAETLTSLPLVFAYDSEVIITTVSSGNSALINQQCMAFGPYWSRITLDMTNFLDKSKWYTREAPAAMSSILAPGAVQGTVILGNNTSAVTSLGIGYCVLEFECAFNELGVTTLIAAPSYTADESAIADLVLKKIKEERLKPSTQLVESKSDAEYVSVTDPSPPITSAPPPTPVRDSGSVATAALQPQAAPLGSLGRFIPGLR